MRSRFENQLVSLNKNLTLMGGLCEEVLATSVQLLQEGTAPAGEPAPEIYQKIESFEREIEEQCLKLLLRQQPVAKDLRRISAALKLVYDMKRIGAQATEVSEIVNQGNIQQGEEGSERLVHLVNLVVNMVTLSIDAFVRDDLELAHQVIQKDQTVDQEFDIIKKELMIYCSGSQVDGEHAIAVLMVAKYLERIGDHAVNIAKWVIFSITGQLDGDEE